MLQEYTHTVDSVAECRNPEHVCAHIALPLAFDYLFRARVLLWLVYILTQLVPCRAFAGI